MPRRRHEEHPRRPDGMLISADVEVWLLRLRLLTLRADVAVTPGSAVHTAPAQLPRSASAARPRPARPLGDGLAAAAASLDAGAQSLRAAREHMP